MIKLSLFAFLLIVTLLVQAYGQEENFQLRSFYAQGGWKAKSKHLIVQHLRDNMKLERKLDNTRYEADLICQIDVNKKRVGKHQMTYYVTGSNALNDKVKYATNIKQFDKQKMFSNYNSTYANPLQFEIYFSQVGTLSESEKDFLSRNNSGIWILKPSMTAQGQGIQMIHNITEIEVAIREKAAKRPVDKYKKYGHQILQKYVETPLLDDNKKMDFRIYVTILQANPLVVVSFPSYTKKTLIDFELDSHDLRVHLGNGDYQKQGVPNYKEIIRKNYHYDIRLFKEKMIEMFPNMTERDFIQIMQKCKAAITYGILAAKDKLVQRKGDHQIFGVDFCIDSTFNPWLLEFNTKPYIVASHPILEQILPDVIFDWLDAATELNKYTVEEIYKFSKKDHRFPCKFLKRNVCELLINEAADYNYLKDLDLDDLFKNKNKNIN